MRFAWYQSGDLFGIRYWLAYGEKIPVHAHQAEFEHNIIVVYGTVRLDLENQDVLLTGTVHDFNGKQSHSITCMSNSAETLHLFLHGIPPGYADLPESERSGTL